MKNLFVVGCGRSGTTMLQQALNRHPRIVIPPETGFFLDFLGHTRKGQQKQLRDINRDLKTDLPPPARRIYRRDDILEFYERLALQYINNTGRKNIEYFGDKSPRHLLCLTRILRLYPKAKIILIYRDGRDVALSLSKVPWGPADLYVNFAIWLRFYRRQQWAMQQPEIDLCCIQYEELVTHPESQLKALSDFLELDYHADMAEGFGNREGVTEREHGWKAGAFEKINPSHIGQWKSALTLQQIEHLERWGGRALTSLRYELNNDNARILPISFFPSLYLKHTTWRIKCAWHLMTKELLAK